MRIIVNADDFGKSSKVNRAIVEAFKKGLISNTTIMVNMPGADEAVQLAKENGFFDKVGLHLNFFSGEPLTEEMKKDKIFVRRGLMTSDRFFHKCSKLRRFVLPKSTRRNLAIEANAQMAKFYQYGFTQKHLDSHGHSHTFISIWNSIKKVVKKFNFESVRIGENVGKKSILDKLYKFIFNKIYLKKYKKTNYFTIFNNAKFLRNKKDVITEYMVHPEYKRKRFWNRKGIAFIDCVPKMAGHTLVSYNYLETDNHEDN